MSPLNIQNGIRNKNILVSTCSIALAILFMPPNSGLADSPFQDKLDNAISQFEKKKRAAAKFVSTTYKKELKRLSRSGSINEATRAELRKRFQSYLQDFQRSGKFPNIVETIELEIKYQDRLSRAYQPIAKLFEDELKLANKKENLVYVDNLLKKKRYLENNLLGSSKIIAGSKLRGKRVAKNGNTIPYVLRIDTISDSGFFEGTVEDNPGIAGHWRYRVNGSLNGSKIQFQMSENLRGSLVVLKASGVFTGNRLVAQLNQKNSKGKSSQHWLTLNR